MTARGKRILLLAVTVILFLLLTVIEIFENRIFTLFEYGDQLYIIATRFLGGIACLLFVFSYSSARILGFKISFRALVVFLPCMLIAINNFPFITFFSGEAYIDAESAKIVVYALACLGVGFFEEIAFRGCIFTAILQRCRRKASSVFWAIVLSSLIFGVVHLVNLFAGASPASVLLQVGYSFLIGGMCSIILIKTANIWYCVILHAVYNFAGGVVPTCGGGVIWNTPTVILTAAVSVAVAAYVIYVLVKITPYDIDILLNEESGKEQTNGEEQSEGE